LAIAFTYDESDNKIVVTGGTSGTPATFADFVTADRAGTAELTPEDAPVACTTNITLTYQIRPVEDLALQITFTLAGTSAGAGDTLDVTGTDWEGNAQGPESIDVSAGDGAYTGANKWRTITDIDCTGWADGTLKVTQPCWGVIWDYGNGQYLIDSHIDFGDGSTSTYFDSHNEMVYFSNDLQPRTVAAATVNIGILSGSWGTQGSMWSVGYDVTDNMLFLDRGTMGIYASKIHHRTPSYFKFNNGNIDIKNSILSAMHDITSWHWTRNFNFQTLTTCVLQDVYFCNVWAPFFYIVPDTFEDVHTHACWAGMEGVAAGVETTGLLVTDSSDFDISTNNVNSTLNCIDPKFDITSVRNNSAGCTNQVSFTCNIHVVDKDGVALQSVVVDCEDTDTTACWTAGTITTDASGDIAEQEIRYKKWTTTSETLKEYSPHKFTLSKAGYETLILESITVDAPIVWHLELQSIKHPPAPWIGDGEADDYQYATFKEAVNQ